MPFTIFFIKLLRPISILVGKIYIAPKKRAIKASHIISMQDVLKVGDIILTYSKGELTNLLLDGDFKHCAMYIGSGTIVEAVGKGVTTQCFEDFCASKDRIAIMRALFCSRAEAQAASRFALFQEGKPYDYNFEPNEDAFYCAELIAESYKEATKDTSPFVKRQVMGVDTVLPNDFFTARKKFDLIMDMPC
jgi:uncharacterized protein YycO